MKLKLFYYYQVVSNRKHDNLNMTTLLLNLNSQQTISTEIIQIQHRGVTLGNIYENIDNYY